MQVEGGLESVQMEVFQQVRGVGEEFLFPGISRPPLAMSRRVPVLALRASSHLPGFVPVHIDNHHVCRNVEVAEMPGKVYKFIIGIQPVAAPPVAQGVFGRKRNLSGNLGEVAHCGDVIVAVSEQIPVYPVSAGTFRHPIFPVGGSPFEEMPAAFVDERPAVSGSDSLVERIFSILTVFLRPYIIETVKRPGRSEQVSGVVHAGVPCLFPSRHPELYFQVVPVESACSGIGQSHCVRGDYGPSGIPAYLESGDRQVAVDYAEARPVFEDSVFRPFQTDKPRSENGETGFPGHDLRFFLRYRTELLLRTCADGGQAAGQDGRQNPMESHNCLGLK